MMIRLRLEPEPYDTQRYENARDDVARWVQALNIRGFEVLPENVYAAWRRHSEENCAGWLTPYDNDEEDCRALLKHLKPDSIV